MVQENARTFVVIGQTMFFAFGFMKHHCKIGFEENNYCSYLEWMGDACRFTVLTLKGLAGDFLLYWPLSNLPSRAKQVNSKVSISAFIAGADVLEHRSTNKINIKSVSQPCTSFYLKFHSFSVCIDSISLHANGYAE